MNGTMLTCSTGLKIAPDQSPYPCGTTLTSHLCPVRERSGSHSSSGLAPAYLRASADPCFLQFSEAEWARWPTGPYPLSRVKTAACWAAPDWAFSNRLQRAATGYVFAQDAWGQGYATESLWAVVEIARKTGVVRLSALLVIPGIQPRVLEKCGFVCEGVLPLALEVSECLVKHEAL